MWEAKDSRFKLLLAIERFKVTIDSGLILDAALNNDFALVSEIIVAVIVNI